MILEVKHLRYSYNNSERLVLTFAGNNVRAIKREFVQDEEGLWVYFGEDFFKRRDMESRLGVNFEHINIAKLHEEVAKDIRLEYTTWMDSLNRIHGDKLDWWFSSISSRNIYNDNLFQYACYLEILKRLYESIEKRPKLVIVESIGLARAIHKWALTEGISVTTIKYYGVMVSSLKQYFLPFLSYMEFIVTQVLKQTAAIFSRIKFSQKNFKNIPFIIIDTFIYDTSISEDGDFKDRHYPFLYEYLTVKGFYILVHAVLFGFRYNYFSIYNRMRKNSTSFIIQEDFLNFLDYLYALSHPIKVLMQKITIKPFRDFDLSDIIREERRKQPFSLGMQAVLIYRLFIRLGEAGIKPLQIIDWYENQVIDKALIAGSHTAFPEVKIIGAQLFIHPPNYLSLYPSQSEVDAQLVPDVLLETSEYQCKIAQEFTTAIPCIPAAALRYAHVFENDNKEPKNKTILVLLSFDIQEAVEMLWMVKDVLYQIKKQVNILIKGHPDYFIKNLIEASGEDAWPSRFKVFTGSMSDALSTASIVVSSNSSSMVEAAAKGIPVIFIGRQTSLKQNSLANLDSEIVTECFNGEELTAAINKYLNLSSDEVSGYKEIGKKIRDTFFTPVNGKTISPFLYTGTEN